MSESDYTELRAAVAKVRKVERRMGLDFFDVLPDDLRWELHVLACSATDFTFWIQQVERDGVVGWRATEIETGISGEVCDTPQGALDSYWSLGRTR